MSLTAAVTEAVMSAPNAIPTADLFGTTTSLGTKFKNAAISLGGAGVAWMLLKGLFKSGLTAVSALMALATAVGLFFLLDNVDNQKLRKPLEDTVNNNLGAPAFHDPVDERVVHISAPPSS